MTYILLSVAEVDVIHDAVLNPGELSGRAGDKSLDGALARVDTRLSYGMVTDVFDLAAAYAIAISQGHCFNDGNKRAAFRVMHVVLRIHEIQNIWPQPETGDTIIRAAQGLLDEAGLATWLRRLSGAGEA